MENILKYLQIKPKFSRGCNSGCTKKSGNVEIQAIGAGAINQAIKAIAIARGFVARGIGIDLAFVPAFQEISSIMKIEQDKLIMVGPRKKRS